MAARQEKRPVSIRYPLAMDGALLPIDTLLPDILRSLEEHPRLVLEAPPGAGKTTRVPLALLAADWRGDRRILMLEPRRVAARAAASFMAASPLTCSRRSTRLSRTNCSALTCSRAVGCAPNWASPSALKLP